MTKPVEFKVLGRAIGTATGWDQADTFAITLYDFTPYEKFKDLPSGDVVICFETGKIETFDDDGEISVSVDIVSILSK